MISTDRTYKVKILRTVLDIDNLFVTSFVAELLAYPERDKPYARAMINVSSDVEGYEYVSKGATVEVTIRPYMVSHLLRTFYTAVSISPLEEYSAVT